VIPRIDTEGKSLWQLVEERVAATPDVQLAIDMQGRTLTYAEYKAWCERAAAGFQDLGVGEGTPVSWILPSRLEALVLMGALSRLGAVQNPILPIYREREVGFMVRQTKCELLVVPGVFRDFDYEEMAKRAVEGTDARILVTDPDLPEGDPATLGPPASHAGDPVRWVMYTSGTVADPKGAKHTDRTLSAANTSMQEAMQISSDDSVAVVFPVTHVGGLLWMFNAMQNANRLLMVEIYSPATAIPFLAANDVTAAGAGTAFHLGYLEAQRRQPDVPLFPKVRLFNGGGAPKPATLHYELLAEMGAPVISGWGLTEFSNIVMVPMDAPDEKKALTEGRPGPGVQVRAISVDDGETVLGPNEEGELRAKGPQMCLGYLDSSLDADGWDAEGWFRTGDLGVIDDDGYVRITGRLKDIIIRKGENISAKEVEDLIFTHPKVIDVAVVGLPDRRSGEKVCAVVVCAEGETLTFKEMTDHLQAQGLITRKWPEQLELVDALPRNPTGKILKRELQRQFADDSQRA
jgi:cyclohexanecarboxylate-CoA ligase